MVIKVLEHEKIGIRNKNNYEKKHISKENAELLRKIEEIKKVFLFKYFVIQDYSGKAHNAYHRKSDYAFYIVAVCKASPHKSR